MTLRNESLSATALPAAAKVQMWRDSEKVRRERERSHVLWAVGPVLTRSHGSQLANLREAHGISLRFVAWAWPELRPDQRDRMLN